MRGLIWVTWRQHRWPIIISAMLTAGLALWMWKTASDLTHLAKTCTTNACDHRKTDPTPSHATYQMNIVVFLPALLAVFWGVPLLAREFEQRTLPLAWSQDVGRQKWLFGKTAILGTLVAAMGTILAGAAVHVAHAYRLYTGESLFEGTQFQAGGWLPLTLALAWLAFGIAAGAATRRVLPAIAVVAAGWITRMVAMPRWRANFMAPMSLTRPIGKTDMPQPTSRGQAIAQQAAQDAAPMPYQSNDLSLDSNKSVFVDSHGGHHAGHEVVDMWCPQLNDSNPGGQLDCLKHHDIVATVSNFQPASRMGTFHVIENSINLSLLVVSLIVAWWCVRRARTTVV